MSIFDRLRNLLSKEGAETKAFFEELRHKADADLGRREAELNETPVEAFERAKQEADRGDDEFARLEEVIGSRLNEAEVAELTRPANPDDSNEIDLQDVSRDDRDPLGLRDEAPTEDLPSGR
jgi:hypothetical protein